MNKMLIAAAAALFALTSLFGSRAEAGFSLRIAAPQGFSAIHKAGCGGGGYSRSYSSYRSRSYRSVSRRVKPKVHVASKPAPQPVIAAKAEPVTEAQTPDTAAEIENSSIASGEGKVADVKTAAPSEKVAAAKDVGCKKFFPSVGITQTVPCE